MKEQAAEAGTDESARVDDRWTVRAPEGSPEAQAGALLRQALRPEPLDAGRLAAIRSRLRAGKRSPRRHWTLRLAIALALLFSGGALTAGAQRYLHWPAPVSRAQPEIPAATRPLRHHTRAAASAPAPAQEAPAPGAASDPAPPLRAPGASRPAPPAPPEPSPFEPAAVTPPPAAPAEASASALAQESRLLAEALRKLRQDDDPQGALAILDEHDARFASGALAPEATLARIEALMKTRRTGDALALLDRAAPVASGGGRELLIARAELRAAAGRCGAASADFDLLLRRDPAFDPITERALWGRASCRAAGADTTGARGDLQDYLARFPDGRFARDARAALGL